mmetsp:Transcript_18166/g.21006  ORF Transcript_18166/g.21006 Transcript_18166/m.21006 type:complete len:614 (-) Transcript_18166:41-1882(-)
MSSNESNPNTSNGIATTSATTSTITATAGVSTHRHKRPKIRTKKSNQCKKEIKSNDKIDGKINSIDALLQQTREKIDCLNINSSDIDINMNININHAPIITTTTASAVVPITTSAANSITVTGQPTGILKKKSHYPSKNEPEYNHQSKQHPKKIVKIKSPNDNHKNSETKNRIHKKYNNTATATATATTDFVKDVIVERKFPKADLYPNQKPWAIASTTATAASVATTKNNDHQDELSRIQNASKIEGYISKPPPTRPPTPPCNSVTRTNNHHHTNDKNTIIETELDFKYMTKDEYTNAVSISHDLGIDVNEFLHQQYNNAENGNNNECENDEDRVNCGTGQEEINEETFFNEEQHQQQNDDDNDDDEDDDDFLSFFSGHEDEDDASNNTSNYTPKPFLLLWDALSTWITPKSVDILRDYKNELFDQDYEDKYSPVVLVVNDDDQTAFNGKDDNDDEDNDEEIEEAQLVVQENQLNSDIAISRCGGLMSMIKMNLAKSLSNLGYDAKDEYTKRMAESRVSEFVQSFDYSEPMVKFDSNMWFALSVLLLDILLPKHDIAYEGKCGVIVNDDDDMDDELTTGIVLPSSISTIGITAEEYKYLTKSAIPSLSRGGG